MGPCGGVASADPLTTLTGGQNFNVLFQQNLNHFYIENPGKLVVDFANNPSPTEEDFSPLGLPVADYNAVSDFIFLVGFYLFFLQMNEITQTNFSVNVAIPNIDCDHCVVRLRYISQNPTENDRGMTFYQCADVKVTKSTEVEVKVAPTAPVTGNITALECCTQKQFSLEGYETASWRNPTSKKYFFDAEAKLFRIDTNSGTGKIIYFNNVLWKILFILLYIILRCDCQGWIFPNDF